ncbi:hypothetical protein HPB51_015726 [Rhipicephalus microplus]|uniref:Uncharacterized protein n=1 Tax=Rhipicephalus microplus TaxID=6941 RepID=A0A9J6ETC2_RHIMP|nr:hypothetical protein HPB51_015726 [Rhipicephalus microplus]
MSLRRPNVGGILAKTPAKRRPIIGLNVGPTLEEVALPTSARPRCRCYVDAAAPDATPDANKALLLSTHGVEISQAYYKAADEQTLLDGVQASETSATCDAYQQASVVLAHTTRCLKTLSQFRRRIQEPEYTVVQFIVVLRWSVNNCDFGTAADTVTKDQILHGLQYSDLLWSFIQMGDVFTVQSALEHAREEECSTTCCGS